MKMLIFTLIVSSAFSVNAQSIIKFDKKEVESLTTSTGEYATLQEIEEFEVKIPGVKLDRQTVRFDLSQAANNIDTIYMNDGRIINVGRNAAVLSGGDGGGGGKN